MISQPNIHFNSNQVLNEINISMNDLLISLKKFKSNKSEGKTFIKNTIIKNCLNGISKIFYTLFNRILQLKQIPTDMKTSIVSPIVKHNKNKNYFSSYRCVSIQQNIYKIFETILLIKLIPFINVNNIIPDSQYGYKKYFSF